jgi:hypothetical protein
MKDQAIASMVSPKLRCLVFSMAFPFKAGAIVPRPGLEKQTQKCAETTVSVAGLAGL